MEKRYTEVETAIEYHDLKRHATQAVLGECYELSMISVPFDQSCPQLYYEGYFPSRLLLLAIVISK